MFLLRKILFSLILMIFIFSGAALVNAANEALKTDGQEVNDKTLTLDNPLGKNVTPQVLIGKIIKGVLGLVGSLALAMFVYGGFTWMLAAGNSANVEKGKQILIWATIGLIVIFSSYAMVQFVFEDVLGVK